MKIKVESAFTMFDNEYVSVKINGQCNHDGAEEDYIVEAIAIDDSIRIPALVCDCGAFKRGYPVNSGYEQYTEYESYWNE